MNINTYRSIPDGQLECWFGKDVVERMSNGMRGWHGPPIPVAGADGPLLVDGHGDFIGRMGVGKYISAADLLLDRKARKLKALLREPTAGVGFASLSALIAAITQGQRRDFSWQKTGTTKVVGVTNSLWAVGAQPVAGGVGSAAPGGRACVDSTTGAIPFAVPGGTDTLHCVTAEVLSSQAGSTLLLYDRLFDVAKTMASAANETVSGVPTRYQSTTNTAADWAGGNFLAIEVATALAATAHNWDAQYTDQDGNTVQALPTVTGNSAAIINRFDHPANSWYCPLAAGDQGIKALTRMTCSASVATGAINFLIGHPLMMLPCPAANLMFIRDGINSALSLARVFDNACLALLEIAAPSTSAGTYSLQLTTAFD
jgi:hypothetical protein